MLSKLLDFLKEEPAVEATATNPAVAAEDNGPIEIAIDAYLDLFAAAHVLNPVLHYGALAAKSITRMLAPLLRSALAAKGWKIVRV